MLEEKDFKRSVSAAVKWQSALEQASVKQTFQNTRTVKRLPKELEIDFEQAMQQKTADTDNELLNAIKINAGRNADASPSVKRDTPTHVCTKFLMRTWWFFPTKAKVICFDDPS